MNTFFLVCAGIGFGLLLLGLVLDDFLDGVFDGLDLDGGGLLSTPVIGAFLGAFGVGGWAAQEATGLAIVGLAAGFGAGVLLGWVAFRLTASLTHMATDATPTNRDYLGVGGRVVTPISGGRGEVLIRIGGSQRKLTARSESDIPLGVEIVVVEVISASSVGVLPAKELFEGQ